MRRTPQDARLVPPTPKGNAAKSQSDSSPNTTG